jgi:multidrug efflux pump subunit AcrA (membrane-fusion protein)
MALDARTKLWAVAAVAALAAILGLLRPWQRTSDGSAAAARTAPSGAAAAAPPSSRNEVRLSAEARKQNPLTLARATRQPLAHDLMLVGSVAFDADHYAIVGPLIAGRIVALHAGSGDQVRRGQILAELESPDVGAAQAAFLEARAKLAAAQSNAQRERELAAQHVSSDREREVAEAQAASEQAALDALADDLAPGELLERVRKAFIADDAPAAVPDLPPAQAAWWTDGGPRVAARLETGHTLPEGRDFTALIDDDWGR